VTHPSSALAATAVLAAALLAAAPFAAHAQAQGGQGNTSGVIKIGELNSYKAQPAFLEPYKKGMELAVAQINAAGGVNGRKLELVTRDDNANPGDAVRVAESWSRARRSTCSPALSSPTPAWRWPTSPSSGNSSSSPASR
jgi:branched-chain amino acid transport system substrate-binding protein